MNWQDQLRAFRDANPDLPPGEDTPRQEPADSLEDKCKRHPRLNVRIERKGRAGKTATLVEGWVLNNEELLEVASRLKQRLGAGGSVTPENQILIQGDRRDHVVALLTEMGFRARSV